MNSPLKSSVSRERTFLYCLFMGLSSLATAQLDKNRNGISDLYEKKYNNGNLFSSSMLLDDDADGDGWSIADEAIFGTNPFSRDGIDGFLQPVFSLSQTAPLSSPSSPEDPSKAPSPATPSGSIAIFRWNSIVGKQYTIEHSVSLAGNDWQASGESILASETLTEVELGLNANSPEIQSTHKLSDREETPSTPSKSFWRIGVSDVDSDQDKLSDYEENLAETNSKLSDTDKDGMNDFFEIVNGLDPNDPSDSDEDSDGDGLSNDQEEDIGTDPNVSDNPGIEQETFTNGDFSEPEIGTGERSAENSPKWDYFTSVPGWTATTGSHIELQAIVKSDPYCELKAELEGHMGLKQQVGTVIGKDYLITFDVRTRDDTTAEKKRFLCQRRERGWRSRGNRSDHFHRRADRMGDQSRPLQSRKSSHGIFL